MTRLVARIKILPKEADTDLERVVESLKAHIPTDFELKRYAKEPIAFGLYSLIGDFTLNDSEGQMDVLEEYIKKTEGVSEIQVIRVSRESVSIK